MSKLDVKELGRESLAAGAFPASSQSDFRVYFTTRAHEGILQHAHQDHSVEICGILVGEWRQDENGPFATVENFIRCDNATSKFAEVTFTHESWAKINEEMDSRFDDKRIVGWYHSHPDFGIFLSDRDCFIHEHFFGGPGQVAFVVDPVRELEGVFAWKSGKPTAMRHYWVGDTVCTVQASVSNPAVDERKRLAQERVVGEAAAVAGRGQPSELPLLTMLLCGLAVFLLGYVASGWQREWERQAVVDGVVSNYTNFKMAKIGLKEELQRVQEQLAAATQALEMTPVTTEKISDEDRQELAKMRALIVKNLVGVHQVLSRVSERYALSDYELRTLSRLQQELTATRTAPPAKVEPSASGSKPQPKEATPSPEVKADAAVKTSPEVNELR